MMCVYACKTKGRRTVVHRPLEMGGHYKHSRQRILKATKVVWISWVSEFSSNTGQKSEVSLCKRVRERWTERTENYLKCWFEIQQWPVNKLGKRQQEKRLWSWWNRRTNSFFVLFFHSFKTSPWFAWWVDICNYKLLEQSPIILW